MKKALSLLLIMPIIASLCSCNNKKIVEVGVFDYETNSLTFDFSECFSYTTEYVTDENGKEYFTKKPETNLFSSNFFDNTTNIFSIPNNIDGFPIYNYNFIGVEEDFKLDSNIIKNYIKNYFKNISFKFIHNDSINIHLKNMNIKNSDITTPLFDLSDINNAEIYISGTNEICQSGTQRVLLANNLHITGNSIDSYLKIKKYDINLLSKESVKCANLSISDVNIDIFGANNINTSNFKDGLKGGDALHAETINAKYSTLNLYAGNGGNGMNGDSPSINGYPGGDSGHCLVLDKPTSNIKGGNLINLYGGNGGTGGKGAKGINGENGRNAGGSLLGDSGEAGKQGGTGGKGGDGGNSLLTSNVDPLIFTIVEDGLGGIAGEGGEGGNGGNGGNAGHGDWADWNSAPGVGGPGGLGGEPGNNGLNWKGEKNPTKVDTGPTGSKGNPGSN